MHEDVRKHRERALKAMDKRSPLGPDIDLGKYSLEAEPVKPIRCLRELPEDYLGAMAGVGVEVDEEARSGSFLQINHSPIFSRARQGGLEVMSVADALRSYDWLREYWWKSMPVDADKYTAQAEVNQTNGYFIRSMPKAISLLPVQACLFMGKEGLAQNVHNVIIAEEGSELHIITGCTAAPSLKSGLHIGVSEFFIKKEAKVTFTMIHSWAEDFHVRPRTGVVIEDNGAFVSNYICLNPVKSLQMYPTAQCVGRGAKAIFQSILYAQGESSMDVGSRVFLKAEGCRAEVTTRAMAKDCGEIYARGHIIGEASNVRGHIECRGLMLSKGSKIHSIPELEAKAQDVELSHEAAIGKIAEEEIIYLMARGLTMEEATRTIVMGFLNIIQELPEGIGSQVKRMLRMSVERAL